MPCRIDDVSEGSGQNLFLVRDQVVYTPSLMTPDSSSAMPSA